MSICFCTRNYLNCYIVTVQYPHSYESKSMKNRLRRWDFDLHVSGFYRTILRTIQIFADNAAAKCISVQSFHQIQHRRTVIRLDRLFVFIRTEHFLRKIKRIVAPLVKRKKWIIFQILQSNLLLFCQRMTAPQVNVFLTVKKLMKFQIVFLKDLPQYFPVKIIQI